MTQYLNSQNVKMNKNLNIGKFFISITLLIVLICSFFGPALISYVKYDDNVIKKAQAVDPVKWFACKWGEDSIPRQLYNVVQTNNLYYTLFSKSSLNSGVGKIDGGWNNLFKLFGYDFVKTNEAILGTKVNKVGETQKEKDSEDDNEKAEFNSGPRVNAFDRFGIAGLTFSSYAGEWKYFEVDPCNDDEPTDPKAGLFYDERLEPQSTWEEIGKSKDIRTKQFSQAFFPAFNSAFNNHVANFFFGMTKIFVTITIALVNFAFSDIVSVIGINEIIAGDGTAGSSSIFNTLFNTLFKPLSFIAIAFTALYIAYLGLIKRQFRDALGTLAKSIALWIVALFISMFPLQAVSLPNNIAVVGQSVILQAMGGSLTKNKGLCTTDKGSKKIIKNSKGSLDFKKNQDLLSNASENMRSVVACQFWQTFLFKPWSEGQFGEDYNSLWANDQKPGLSSKEKTLNNDNEDWVGDAAVPMGNGEYVNNWALFQMSTQTNVHSPIGKENEIDSTTMGVARDWWRIVDALANYAEETVEDPVNSESGVNGENITLTQPKKTKVSKYWDTWVGNNSSSRIWISISSILISVVGLSIPFLFSLFAAVYSIGLAILMALAPVMLLIGVYQPKGWDIFKSWAQEVINLVIKRIVFGFMLVLSLIFTTAAIDVMNEVGWVQGLLLVIVFSLVLWKFKDQILNSFAAVSFAASTNINGNLVNKMKGIGKGSARAGTAGVVGAVSSKKNGGSFRSGIAKGAGTELRQQMYRSNSPFARSILTQQERVKGNEADTRKMNVGETLDANGNPVKAIFCSICAAPIIMGVSGGRLMDGSIVCQNCMDEGVAGPNVIEQVITDDITEDGMDKATERKREQSFVERQAAQRTPHSSLDTKKGAYNEHQGTSSDGAAYENYYRQAINSGDMELATKMSDTMIRQLAEDITTQQLRNSVDYVEIPSQFEKYFDNNAQEEIKEAWANGNYEFIQGMYAAALSQWMVENSRGKDDAVYENVLSKIEEEVLAQKEIRSRNEGEEIDFGNVNIWNVNGSKKYAYDNEEGLYAGNYRSLQRGNAAASKRTENYRGELKLLKKKLQDYQENMGKDLTKEQQFEIVNLNTKINNFEFNNNDFQEGIKKNNKTINSDLETKTYNSKNLSETRKNLNQIERSEEEFEKIKKDFKNLINK